MSLCVVFMLPITILLTESRQVDRKSKLEDLHRSIELYRPMPKNGQNEWLSQSVDAFHGDISLIFA